MKVSVAISKDTGMRKATKDTDAYNLSNTCCFVDIASKFLEHFFHISDAMTYNSGGTEKSLWDKTDSFFYDSISWPGGGTQRLKTRSLGKFLVVVWSVLF